MSKDQHAGQDRFGTRCIHAGQQPDLSTGAIMTPVYMTSTFVQSSPGVFKDGYDYARSKNPTRTALEANLAALEGARHGFTFSSGLAAMDCVLHQLRGGDHVVLSDDVYGGSFRQLDKVFRHVGVEVTRVDMTKAAEVERAMRPATRLLWLETPSNPMLKVIDIAGMVKIAKAWVGGSKSAPGNGARDTTLGPLGTPIEKPLVLVDNTFASPYLQNPLSNGADIVLHSCTKYIGGHSDLVAGALATNDDTLAARLRFVQNAVGAVPSAMDCFLMLRSTKTLHVRMQRHCDNAMKIAQWLTAHAKVERVIYPGLPTHAQHALAKSQMRGFGGMISVVIKGGLDPSKRMLERVKLFSLAESLGGVESLIEHPAIMTHSSIPADARRTLGIDDGLVRLSVGIEDVEDLTADLERALA